MEAVTSLIGRAMSGDRCKEGIGSKCKGAAPNWSKGNSETWAEETAAGTIGKYRAWYPVENGTVTKDWALCTAFLIVLATIIYTSYSEGKSWSETDPRSAC